MHEPHHEARRREQKEIMKQAFKEAFREEFQDIKQRLGGWTIKAVGAWVVMAVIIGLVWFLLTVNGWHHIPNSAQQRVENK